jgi:glucosamine-6-phosphate deaminase
MDVIIRPNRAAACQLVARVIAAEIRRKPHLVLGLATGSTMEGVYGELVRLHREEKLDFSLCRTFNLDEYIGLPPGHPNSYHRFMRERLFNLVNIDQRNTHLPNGLAPDLDAECERYEEMIRDVGGIDLQLLGIGRAGHIGFNEPLSAFRSRTRVKALSPATVAQNTPLFANPADMPRRAITMGVGTILDTSRCILLATGTAKADIVARAVEGPIAGVVSATALQLHPRCNVVVDEEAASGLEGGDYYRWIFGNEPEWEAYR